MAADHGVTAQGVSQYPSEVTGQMVRNFAAGGAGINALATVAGSRLVVVDMGVAADLSDLIDQGAILDRRNGPGTADIGVGPAMSLAAARTCIEIGIDLATELAPSTDLFGTGDMGIGNTTPSAALAMPLVEAAARLLTDVHTFAEAGVSTDDG